MHTKEFLGRAGKRYWWWRIPNVTHDPLFQMIASESERKLLADWYTDTENKKLIGECAPPLISLLMGFLVGNSVERMVQLGHYAGYSTLHIGILFRKMAKGKLYTIDIAERMSAYTQSWVEKAGIGEHVCVVTGDSADVGMPSAAAMYLGGQPDIVFIDSSHKYDHTLKELDLWYEALRPNGFIFLHDASRAAREYDPANGAVAGALADWCKKTEAEFFVLNGGNSTPAKSHSDLVYRDGRGLGIIQKRNSI